MSKAALIHFLEKQVAAARSQDLLFSLHMKATMMKISDPIIFGHVVKAYYAAALNKHAAALEQIGFDPNNGIGDLYRKLSELPICTKSRMLNAELSRAKLRRLMPLPSASTKT